MKKDDVKVDGTYLAKVNGGVVPVRITGEKWQGDKHTGWVGVNTQTNRSVRIKSAARLRGEVQGQGGGGESEAEAPAAATTTPAAPAVKPPNYMRFCCSLDRAVKAAQKTKDPLLQERVQDLRNRATAAYKAKDYALAVDLHDRAHAALAADAGATAPHAGEGASDPTTEATPAPPATAGKRGGKTPRAEKAPKPAKPKKTSALDAAAIVLAAAGAPMKPKDMIALMEAKGLWTSPGGKTPEATLYAAIIREIAAKRSEARFRKTERGTFIATEHAAATTAGKEG